VHEFRGMGDQPPNTSPSAWWPEAHAQHRQGAPLRALLDHLDGGPRLLGRTRARRDEDAVEPLQGSGNGVVAHHTVSARAAGGNRRSCRRRSRSCRRRGCGGGGQPTSAPPRRTACTARSSGTPTRRARAPRRPPAGGPSGTGATRAREETPDRRVHQAAPSSAGTPASRGAHSRRAVHDVALPRGEQGVTVVRVIAASVGSAPGSAGFGPITSTAVGSTISAPVTR
jgi:hypothetical protein